MRTINRSILFLILLFAMPVAFADMFPLEPVESPTFASEQTLKVCEAGLEIVVFAREARKDGYQDEEVAYVKAMLTGERRTVALKLLKWGFAFYSSHEDQLRGAFMSSCLTAGGPNDMSEVDQR